MSSAIVSQKEIYHDKNMSLANEEKNGAIYSKKQPTHFSLKPHPIPILDPVFPNAEKQGSGVLVRCGTVTRWISDNSYIDSSPLTSRKTITEPTPSPVSENDTLLLISARTNSSSGSLVRYMDSNKTNRPIVSGLGGLTLEAIYRILTKSMTSIDDLSLETMIGPSNVASYLEWTLDAMRGYVSQDKVALNDDDTVSFVGKDLMYASMIVELVGSCPENYHALATTTALCSILVSMLDVFQDALLVQNTVQTILTLCCYSSEYVVAFTKQPNIACILVSILRRGRIETSYCYKALDTIMPTRLELLRRMAEKCRHIFDGTDLLTQLLALWNCLDKQSYGFVHYQSPDDLRELRGERLRCTTKTLNWDAFVLPPVKQLTHSQSNLPHTPNHDMSKTCRKAQSDITWEASKPEGQSREKLCLDLATQRIQKLKYECYNQRQAASCSAAASRAEMGAADAPLLTEARKASIDSFSSSILDDCSVSSTDSKRCHACTAYYGPSEPSTQRDTMRCLMHLLATVCSPEFNTNVCKYTLGLRLLCLVVDVKTCDPSIVANAFYVLGMIVGELQNIFYQLQAVDLICDILRASYRYDKKWGNEVVGYACLTLASLCAQHLENTAIIVEDTRLIQLVVRILDQRASFHDDLGIHGASALLCNLLYKNDVARTRFGYVDVCQVLVKTLKSILPPHTPKRYPPVCLFRAIGNVGLCHENCATFIKEGLGVTYAAYLEQCITTATPSTAEACCKALANLVMDCRHVEGFQTCLDPLMEFLRLECDNAKASEYLYDLYLCAFEALGNLCRNPSASQRFAEKNYIQILLRLLPLLPYSDLLYAKAFYLLRNQVSNPTTAAKLVCKGLLELCERIIDNGARRLSKVENNSKQSEDVPDRLPRSFYLLLFSALRCLYRVVVTKDDVKRCVEARCVPALVRLYLANLRSSSLASHTLCVFLRIFHNFSNHSDLSSPSESETTSTTTTTPRKTPRSTQSSKNGSASVVASPSNQKLSAFKSKKKENSLSTLITDTSFAEDENSTFATAFEALQLHQSAWDDMIIATRLYLANKKLFHDLRFCKLALGFLAYLAFPSPSEAFYNSIFDGENNANVSFELAFNDPSRKTIYHTRNAHKTSLGDVQKNRFSSADRETESRKETPNTEMPCIANPFSLVKQIERCFVTHKDIALFEECVYLLNHIVLNAQSPERRRAIMDTPFLHAYKAFLFQNDAALDLGKYSYNLYALVHAYHAGIMLRTSVTFYLTNEALIRPYRCLMAKPFPLHLTGWTAPTFLDGTQGLPDDVKTYLLQGEKLCWVASKAVKGSWKQESGVFYWRASSDLIQLNWSTARRRTLFKKNTFTHQVPIRCCSVITRGFVEDAAHLRNAPYQDTHVVTITYTKHYEHQLAGGIVLGLKNAQVRDALFRILTLWRDAALYGL